MTTETIDYSKTYKIEAIPNKDVKELAEKGLSTYPGVTQYVTAAWNDRLKRFSNTGLDENAPEVLLLTGEKKKEAQERIKAKREELEALMGSPGYLLPTSDAWLTELCIVEIEVGQDLKIRVNGHDNVLRPAENYKDAIAIGLILSNPKFPKNKAESQDPRFKDAKFYLTTDDEQSTAVKGKIQKTRRANIEMAKLFDDAKNKQRAWEVAFKMGLVNKQKVSPEFLEMRMQDAIFNDKTGKTIDEFLEVCELDNTTLAIHNIFQTAINSGVINIAKDGTYSRGHVNYRKLKEDSIKYLLSPGMELELAELKSAVEAVKKKHNAIG